MLIFLEHFSRSFLALNACTHRTLSLSRNRNTVFDCVWQAPVAQLDRASDYESEGRAFESLRARHLCTHLRTPSAASSRPEMACSSLDLRPMMRSTLSSTSNLTTTERISVLRNGIVPVVIFSRINRPMASIASEFISFVREFAVVMRSSATFDPSRSIFSVLSRCLRMSLRSVIPSSTKLMVVGPRACRQSGTNRQVSLTPPSSARSSVGAADSSFRV